MLAAACLARPDWDRLESNRHQWQLAGSGPCPLVTGVFRAVIQQVEQGGGSILPEGVTVLRPQVGLCGWAMGEAWVAGGNAKTTSAMAVAPVSPWGRSCELCSARDAIIS